MLLFMAVGFVGITGGLIQVVAPLHPAGRDSPQPAAAGDPTRAWPTGRSLEETPLSSTTSGPPVSPTPDAEPLAPATPIATPSASRSRPPSPNPPTTQPAPPPPVFAPITVEAEARSSQLRGGALAVACPACAGGYRVGYIAGAAEVRVITSVPMSGWRTIVVTYESDGLRLMKVSVNGIEIAERWLTGTGWETPYTFTLSATLSEGPLRLAFYNDVGPAPDLDQVVIM